MPAAYLISESLVTDQALMDEYGEKAGPSVAAYDGELIAASTDIAHMDGMWKPPRVVMIRFPSMERAKEWYNSPGYQAVLPLRFRASESSVYFVEAVE